MRLFWEIAKRSFQRHLTYRAAALAGLATNFFFGLLRMAILVALYGQRDQVADVTIQGAITYMALIQALIGYLSVFSWYDLMRTVHSGEVAADLLKPMNLFSFWLAQDLGRALVNLLLRGFTLMIIYALFLDLSYPKSIDQWIALFLVMVLAWLVSFSWRFLVNLASFWTPNALGIGRFFFVVSWFFSGLLMPLRYFPDWVIRLAILTPFPHMLNTILDVYVGALEGLEIVQAMTIQVFWIFVLTGMSHLVLRAGVRKLVILGG